MDKSMQGIVFGVIAFVVIYGLSVLKVSSLIIGVVLLVALVIAGFIMRHIKL
ncbi:hypothetical protein [Companilactobacillus nuruki]|uniref:hypothetical protein n=1 Tax=Companilactobacillus nuruki TaxID=1993540 RepID=UPI00141701CE|nr:hypothetical protein [Companilactobacillus nuruki]